MEIDYAGSKVRFKLDTEVFIVALDLIEEGIVFYFVIADAEVVACAEDAFHEVFID